MEARIKFQEAQGAVQAMKRMSDYLDENGLEQSLVDLILVRASQINRCAFCLDMHTKDARVSGETEQRLYALNAWRDTPFYSDRERAALAWTEAVTLVSENGVSDELYEQVRRAFSEQEIIGLTMAVISINSWNRLNVSLQMAIPGQYKSQRKPEAALHAAN